MCFAPLNNNLSRDWNNVCCDGDGDGGVGGDGDGDASFIIIIASCSLMYCASGVWLRSSSSFDA